MSKRNANKIQRVENQKAQSEKVIEIAIDGKNANAKNNNVPAATTTKKIETIKFLTTFDDFKAVWAGYKELRGGLKYACNDLINIPQIEAKFKTANRLMDFLKANNIEVRKTKSGKVCGYYVLQALYAWNKAQQKQLYK